MKTLTVEEATSDLGRLVELALAGEQIQIRKGSGVVELRPAPSVQTAVNEKLTPREALRQLQENARITPSQAETNLRELRGERLADEHLPPEDPSDEEMAAIYDAIKSRRKKRA